MYQITPHTCISTQKNGKQNSHVASKVAEPDVIAGVSEKEAERFASISDHPVSGGAEQSMLAMLRSRSFVGTFSLTDQVLRT